MGLGGGAIFPGELVGFPSPSRRPWHPRGLGFWWGGGPRVHVGAGRGCPRGSRSRLPGISYRRWSRTAGNWVCLSPSRHLRRGWGGPWLGRKVGAARVNFAQSLGGVLVKDSPDVRGVSSLWMLECVGQCRRLRLKGCEVSLWRLLSDRLVVGCESWTLAFWLLSDLLHS